MAQDRDRASLASLVLELQRDHHDSQRVLTHLVKQHGILMSKPSSATLSLPSGPPLSNTVTTLHQLLHHYLHSEEEIVWCLCRVVAAWGRSLHRFKLEAGHIRMWKTLKMTRATYPDSPRVIEASLESTVVLFDGVKLHQLFASRGASEDELVDEMLQLLDRFSDPPARVALLSPHHDYSRIVVLALDVLCKMIASPRVTSTGGAHGTSEQYTRPILERMLLMLPHFLKNSDASRTWLTMCRLQLQYAPPLALRILFHETATSTSSSWCRDLTNMWGDDPRVMYDFAALFTQVLATPHGSKILPAASLSGDVSQALILDHGVLDIMLGVLDGYSARLQDRATTPATHGRLQPVVLEIARAIRQFASVPDMLVAFPKCFLAKKSLVPTLVSELNVRTTALRVEKDPYALQHHLRTLLELLLILQRLVSMNIFARTIKATETLQTELAQARHSITTILASSIKKDPHDAGDSDLPAVLLRELNALTKAITALPAPPSTREQHSSATRGLQRLPSSSSSRWVTRQSSLSRTTQNVTSTNSLRRTPSTSFSSSLPLVRTSSQRHV